MRYVSILLIAITLVACQSAYAAKSEIMVSAAASLTDSFVEIGKLFERKHPGVKVRFNFASSGGLAAQIEQGAPVDVFVSASAQFIDQLAQKDLIVASTRQNIASNRIAVVAPTASKLKIKSLADLKSPNIRRIGFGMPDSVPAGRYSTQAIKKLKLWDILEDKFVYGSDVRQVRTYVEQGEVEAGLVFRTDIPAAGLKQVYLVPATLHSPIVYCAAATRQSTNLPEAKKFVKFTVSKDGLKILAKCGFAPPVK